MQEEADDGAVEIDGRRRLTARERRLAGASVSLSVIAAIYGLYLARVFGKCGTGGGSESFGWIKLMVGSCLLAAGFGVAICNRSVKPLGAHSGEISARDLMQPPAWVTSVCALSMLFAWIVWLDRWSGCSS